MMALASSLVSYIEQHFRAALTRDPSGPFRPILVGPPDEALREIFGLLTRGGQGDWQIQLQGATHPVVVLLVDDRAPPAGTGLSLGCHWDYAVTIRNSSPLVLILAARSSWDNRPDSLANTTETLGGIGKGSADSLNPYLVNAIATHLGLQVRHAREVLRAVQREADRLEPLTRDLMPWQVIDALLAIVPGASPIDSACQAAGFPAIGTGTQGPAEAYEILTSFAEFVGSTGLHDAIDQMKTTNAAQAQEVSVSLDLLCSHLSGAVPSPTAFETSPSRYYRASTPIPAWYTILTAELLAEILRELNRVRPQDRISLTCTNALPGVQPLTSGPFITASAAELRATSTTAVNPSFVRKVDRTPWDAVPVAGNPMLCVDANPPVHRKAIKYRAEAQNHRPGSVEVIVLDSFECGGLAHVRDAEHNGIPSFAARAGTWSQEITLSRGGSTEVRIFHASHAAQVTFTRQGDVAATPVPCQPGTSVTSVNVEIEENDTFDITVSSMAAVIGRWSLQFTVRDTSEFTPSMLEALVRRHRTGTKSIPRAANTPLHRLELGSYLTSPDSWKPVLACWATSVPARVAVDWQGDRMLGNVRPATDPRPPITAPSALIAAREAIRRHLLTGQRPFSELELGTPDMLPLAEAYLSEYLALLQQDAQSACWLDVIAVYAATRDTQAGAHVATREPVVILLSPLHPLRFSWHVAAQHQLVESLNVRCPAAGLLTPGQCPDAGALHLWDSGTTTIRSFFALPCDHPHWAVLLNTVFLDRDERASVSHRLVELGLSVRGITGGFTSQQTQDSLREVSRLLPARATLRIGIIGQPGVSSECGTGVFRWSEAQHSEDLASANGCLQVEVFDTREASDPSPEQLADLAENTGERVRWFHRNPDSQLPRLDLGIIDQLSVREPHAATAATRSVISPGGLVRVRIREDSQNAQTILESRVATTCLVGTSLSQLLPVAIHAYEDLSAKNGQSHFRFTPNQEAIGNRLSQTIFLSVTSSQIDPACIVRGTVGQGGYLWDYELPGILGGGESNLGYYLVAHPTPAMYEAVERAAALVVNPVPGVAGLLDEISRHGIPILKRLASGGSQSRGELGLLLATRLVQDAFRAGTVAPRLPVWQVNCIHLILPVDPYEELFDSLRGSLLPPSAAAQRPDLVVVAIRLPTPGSGQPVAIKMTPVEVKYRTIAMSNTDMADALKQAANLGQLLTAVWVDAAPTALWTTCGRALLAQFLDFGFRIYAANSLHGHAPSEWAATHQKVLQEVLEGASEVTVNGPGRLLVFDGSGTTRVVDLDTDGEFDTIVVCLDDARALLCDVTPSQAAATAVQQMGFSFPDCGATVPAQPATPTTPSPSASVPSTVPAITPTVSPPSTPETKLPADPAPAATPSPISLPTSSIDTPPVATPRAVVGWTSPATRWAAVGKLSGHENTVVLDLDHPKTVGVYGYMGSGKSYLLGNLIESAVKPIPGINTLPVPLAVVVFNYRRNASDRFELSSLASPNQNPADIERLAREYGAAPTALDDMHVLCLPGELRPGRQQEYGTISASELYFDPRTLGAEDWELLMGEPGSEAVFARTIRNTLVELRSAGDITLDLLEQQVGARLNGQSRNAARLRFDFVRRYISTTQGTDFGKLLRAGRVLVVDLRQPLFNKDDALRFFLVCANQISKVQGQFNKMIVFDEAHEYMSDAFGERMESRIRLMRHEGTSYVFATQDVGSIPLSISRFLTTRFVFDLGTRENVQDLEQAAPDFRGYQLLGMRPGYCLIHASTSANGMFARPREIRVRPRATQHGGASQIFSTGASGESPSGT